METYRQILPVLSAFLAVVICSSPQAQDGRDNPDRQNDCGTDQGEREEDAKCFHDDVRREGSAEECRYEPQAFYYRLELRDSGLESGRNRCK